MDEKMREGFENVHKKIDTTGMRFYANHIVPLIIQSQGHNIDSKPIDSEDISADFLNVIEGFEDERLAEKQRALEAHQAILKALWWQRWACIWTAICALVAIVGLLMSLYVQFFR